MVKRKHVLFSNKNVRCLFHWRLNRLNPSTIVVFSVIEILLTEPFDVKPNTLNKHGVSALWLAARYNYLDIGMALLQFNPNPEFQADPNVQV
jgi:hypothetical protein